MSSLASAVAIAAVAIAVWSLLARPPATPPANIRAAITLPPNTELALARTAASAISPDGQRVAFVGSLDETFDSYDHDSIETELYLRELDEMEAHPVEGTAGATMPFFSPDGQWLGFLLDGRLMKVPTAGGAAVPIVELASNTRYTGNNIRGASWCEGGWIVLTPNNNSGLARIPAEGGELEVLTVLNKDNREKSHRLPECLPGGEAAVFTLATGDIETFDDASIAVYSHATGEYRTLLDGGTNPHYSATGHIVYAHADAILAVPFDATSLELRGTPVPVLEGVTSSSFLGPAEFSVSRSGTLVYGPGGSWTEQNVVLSVDRTGQAETLVDSPRGFREPRMSPDGRSLTFWIDGANTGVWVYDIERSNLSRLAFGFDSISPVWTPDGTRIVFRYTRDGPGNLYWQPADGSAPAEPLVVSPASTNNGSWSPDGTTFIYDEASDESGRDLWILSLPTKGPPEAFLQTPANEQAPAVSPDGRWVAYESDESGQSEVYLTAFPKASRRWSVSAGGAVFPVWNPNGRELFFRSGEALMAVAVTTINGELRLGRPTSLFELRSARGFDVSHDGERFIMVTPGERTMPRPRQLNLVLNWGAELERLAPSDN